jgi:hypothetical protein
MLKFFSGPSRGLSLLLPAVGGFAPRTAKQADSKQTARNEGNKKK